jgi:hypothetical protein
VIGLPVGDRAWTDYTLAGRRKHRAVRVHVDNDHLTCIDKFEHIQLQQSVLDQLNWLKPELSRRYETWRASQDAHPSTDASSTPLNSLEDKPEKKSDTAEADSSEDRWQLVEKESDLDNSWIEVHAPSSSLGYVPQDQRSDPFAYVCPYSIPSCVLVS